VAVGVGAAVLAADGATVLVAGIGSGPGRDAAAVDVDGAMLRADARSVYPQTLGIGNQLFSPFLSCFYCLSRNNA